MGTRIIEQSVIGKANMEDCEDGMAVTENFTAVIDGSTSKTAHRINQHMSNGRFCMETVRSFVSTMPSDISVENFCRCVTERIKKVYAENGVDIIHLACHPEDRMTASVIIYSATRRQIWLVGDCQCLIDGILYDNPKPLENTLANMRSDYLHNAIEKGLITVDDVINGVDPGREFIMPKLIESCKGQNVQFSVVDGFAIPLCSVKVIDIPAGAKEIVLASDGYPQLCSTLADSEAALRNLLVSDPLCINLFKATKGLRKGNTSFDDRSYIRLAL